MFFYSKIEFHIIITEWYIVGEHFLKVSRPLRQSLKSFNPKFVMDMCASNNNGVT